MRRSSTLIFGSTLGSLQALRWRRSFTILIMRRRYRDAGQGEASLSNLDSIRAAGGESTSRLTFAAVFVSALVVGIGLASATNVRAQALSVRFQGQVAEALIVIVQPSLVTPGALVVTEIAVIVEQGKFQLGGAGAPTASSFAVVLAAQSEVVGLTATLQFLFLGLVEAAPVAFDTAFPKVPTLAAFSATVPGLDLVSGGPTALVIDLSWTGVGDPSHVNALLRIVIEDIVLLSRENGFIRESTAAGTIVGFPVPISLAGGPIPPLVLAAVGSLNVGELVVS